MKTTTDIVYRDFLENIVRGQVPFVTNLLLAEFVNELYDIMYINTLRLFIITAKSVGKKSLVKALEWPI